MDCGTACPSTCDNYDVPVACTLQCVSGCFCPPGKVDVDGVCVDPSMCSGATASEMQQYNMIIALLYILTLGVHHSHLSWGYFDCSFVSL